MLPAISWMVVIFVSSAIPSEEFPKLEFWGWPKLIHLFYYAVLCFLLHRALRFQRKFPLLRRHAILFAVAFATLYGATDEFHQMFTPGRHALVSDVIIDGVGALLFIVAMKVISLFRMRTQDVS